MSGSTAAGRHDMCMLLWLVICVCALLYEQNKVLLEGREKELEGCRRSQNEVSSMETYIHVHTVYSISCMWPDTEGKVGFKSWKMLC